MAYYTDPAGCHFDPSLSFDTKVWDLETAPPAIKLHREVSEMATIEMDTRGLRCPLPVLKMTSALVKDEVEPGDTLIVLGDCPTFEKDVRDWCRKMKAVLIALRWLDEGIKRAEIRL